MKVVQVYPTYTSIKGGVERHIQGLSKYLVRRGHQVEIFTTESGYDLLTYDAGRITVKRGHKFTSLFASDTYDIVHIHGYRVPWANLFGFLRKLGGRNVVMTTHGIYPPRSKVDALAKMIYDNTLGRINIEMFDILIALTLETRDALISLGADQKKIWIVPNSIDTKRFQNPPSPAAFLNYYGIPRDKKVVLYVGRVDWNKGLDQALAGFSMVVKEVPDAIFIIVGKDWGYMWRLKQISHRLGIKDKIYFTGEITEFMLHSAYAVADILLLTSIYEGLPTVALEAMACSVPVVAFRTGGTVYIIKHGKTGLLVDFGDFEGLAEQIKKILLERQFKAKLVEHGKVLVENRYGWAKNSAIIEQLYNSILTN